MLYNSFRASLMICAILGILHMIAECSFVYIFFPIAILIWGFYTFFNEDDEIYFRYNDNANYGKVNYYQPYAENNKIITYKAKDEKFDYHSLKDKCKRNFKITIAKEKDNETS